MADSSDPRETILAILEQQKLLDGRFEDLRRIGSNGGNGAFSVLVSANDRALGNRVALKFFDPRQRTNEYRWKAFQREAQLLPRFIGQPDILQSVAPMAEFTELAYMNGMPWPVPFAYYGAELAGGDLGQEIADRLIPARERLLQFRVMCRAVQRIHRQGVVHRDLKPNNFLLMKDRTLKLSDFGTARSLLAGERPLEDTYSMPPGDLRYAAPEIIACLHDVDADYAYRADIYALGAILFEMFSGTQLNLHVFDHATLADLNTTMNVVDRADRLRVYNAFVAQLADSHPLPNLSGFGSNIPNCILEPTNQFYMAMSAVDYRRRLTGFGKIFDYINRCLFILDHEATYRELRRRRTVARDVEERKRADALTRAVARNRSLMC